MMLSLQMTEQGRLQEAGPSRHMRIIEDFIGSPGSGVGWSSNWMPMVSSMGASIANIPVDAGPGHIGILTVTGTTLNGYLSIPGPAWTALGNGDSLIESCLRMPVANNGANDLLLRVGFVDAVSIAAPTNGIYLEYGLGPGATWQAVARAGGVETRVNTGVTLGANVWCLPQVVHVGATGHVRYGVNGQVLTEIDQHVPGGDVPLMLTAFLGKVVGTTAKVAHVDYVAYEKTFATPR